MTISYRILLILCIFWATASHAQYAIVLKGEILNDGVDVSNLTVVNRSSQIGTTTTKTGFFQIKSQLGDTIVISALQYEPRVFKVTASIFKKGSVALYLTPKITELDQIAISNIGLTGDIFKDVAKTRYKPVITAKKLGLPVNTAPHRTVEERRYYTATTSSGGIPLDGLLNSITGRLKMLKHHIAVSRLQQRVKDTRAVFSDNMYHTEFGVPKEYIEDFIYFVIADKKAIPIMESSNSLELLEYLRNSAIAYRKLKEFE